MLSATTENKPGWRAVNVESFRVPPDATSIPASGNANGAGPRSADTVRHTAACAFPASAVTYRRTTDYAMLDEIIRIPEIYEWSGDDTSPPREQVTYNRDPLIWYVLAEDNGDNIGLFVLHPRNFVCWELHGAMLPTSTTRAKWSAARGFCEWLWRNTPCRRLIASIPESNGRARMYVTHGLGMKCAGRHERAILRHGQLEDLILFGRSAEEV